MKYTCLVALIASASAVNLEWEHLLSCAPTEPASHPINYFVPEFGANPDIANSFKQSEAITLTAKTKDEDGEKVFPYQAEKFKVNKKLKLNPTMEYPRTEEWGDNNWDFLMSHMSMNIMRNPLNQEGILVPGNHPTREHRENCQTQEGQELTSRHIPYLPAPPSLTPVRVHRE